jgi:tRNA-guanine family transglycosylase
MYRSLDQTVPLLPAEKVRYLMGVGSPDALLEGVSKGVYILTVCFQPALPAMAG